MLDRHAVRKLLDAGVKPRAVAEQFRVSRRTIERIAHEAEVRSSADGMLRHAGEPQGRPVGRPGVTAAIRARVQALVLDDPECPPGEICRLLRADGMSLGLVGMIDDLVERATTKRVVPPAPDESRTDDLGVARMLSALAS